MTKKLKIMEAESTLTDRYQTTIPEPIRDALHLEKRDKISYVVDDTGRVTMTRAQPDDPDITQFLNLVVEDIKNNEHVYAISPALQKRAQKLIADVDIDLDAPLADKDE